MVYLIKSKKVRIAMNKQKAALKRLLKFAEENKKNKEMLEISDYEGDKLYYALAYNNPQTELEWRVLQFRVHNFLNSSAPKAEKDKLLQYTEMIAMIISGYDYMEREYADGPAEIQEMSPEELDKIIEEETKRYEEINKR